MTVPVCFFAVASQSFLTFVFKRTLRMEAGSVDITMATETKCSPFENTSVCVFFFLETLKIRHIIFKLVDVERWFDRETLTPAMSLFFVNL